MPVGVLDACRNNPFEAGGTRDIGFSRGVAQVAAPEGRVIQVSAGEKRRGHIVHPREKQRDQFT